MLGLIAISGLTLVALLILWRATRSKPSEHFSSDSGLDHLVGSGRLHSTDKRREGTGDDASETPDD